MPRPLLGAHRMSQHEKDRRVAERRKRRTEALPEIEALLNAGRIEEARSLARWAQSDEGLYVPKEPK